MSYRWVAYWRIEGKDIIVEVYYVGTRENAHTDFTVEGFIPNELLVRINDTFGNEYLQNAEQMDWYKRAEQLELAGENLKFYRERKGLTQTQLSKETGISKQLISMMGRNRTAISKTNALSFSIDPDEFLKAQE